MKGPQPILVQDSDFEGSICGTHLCLLGCWVLLSSAASLLKVVPSSCTEGSAGWNHCLVRSVQGLGAPLHLTWPHLGLPEQILEHCTPLLSWHRACPQGFQAQNQPKWPKGYCAGPGSEIQGQKLNGASERSHPTTEEHISMAGGRVFFPKICGFAVSLWLSASSLI